MATTDEYRRFIAEQLEGLGAVRIEPMFGGAGVFLDDLMFAILVDDGLYFKVDDGNRGDFEARGMTPFVYQAKGKEVAMSYWRAPDFLYDDGEAMTQWARNAHGGALAQAKQRKTGR